MPIKVIGLIKVLSSDAFENYRSRVGATVALYGGNVSFRGSKKMMPWNELACADFDAVVELEFPSLEQASRWAGSSEYSALLPIRSEAMRLTLFVAE